MGNKVFVGNLAFSVNDSGLREMFASCGDITEASVIINKFNGRSKGFGFVTFASDEAAQKAVSDINGKEIDGRQIKVSEAKPMEPGSRPPRRSFGGGGFGGGGRSRF